MLLHPALLQPAMASVDKSEQSRSMLTKASAIPARLARIDPLTVLCALMVEGRDRERCLAGSWRGSRASRSKRSFRSLLFALAPTNKTSPDLSAALRLVSIPESAALGGIAQFTVVLKPRDVRSRGI